MITEQRWTGAYIVDEHRQLTPEFKNLSGTYLKHMAVYPNCLGVTVWGLGQMLYPNPVGSGIYGSLRWEMMREGAEDHEYLWLLQERLGAMPADEGADICVESPIGGNRGLRKIRNETASRSCHSTSWGLDGRGNTCDSNTMKVTTKGQVTIPARIREYLDIAAHSDVDFRISGGAVVLVKDEAAHEPRRRFGALRGVLKGTRTTQQWMRATRGN